jgi:cytidyltransferase-like protein
MNDNIVVFTGGFDPIHSGHIEAIKDAQQYGRVILGLNSDEWLTRKKGRPFMPFEERKAVLDQFKNVLAVIGFDDSDNSASDAIRKAREMFPKSKIIFVNGGDRTAKNIPEMDAFKDDPMVEFKFSVGGENKKNSSSWILSEWKHPSESRQWGKFMTYYDSKEAKVKRLVIDPAKSISMQYHNSRSEFWFVESGEGILYTMTDHGEKQIKTLRKHDSYHIEVGQWHRVENSGSEPLQVIEIQYGSECKEEDIVRKL